MTYDLNKDKTMTNLNQTQMSNIVKNLKPFSDLSKPSEFIKKSRQHMKKVDASFENCFSYAFEDETHIKRLRKKYNRIAGKISKRLPNEATKDSISAGLKQLKILSEMGSIYPKSHRPKFLTIANSSHMSSFGNVSRLHS